MIKSWLFGWCFTVSRNYFIVIKRKIKKDKLAIFAASWVGSVKCLKTNLSNILVVVAIFSCPGSSLPELGHSLGHWVSQCPLLMLTQRVTLDTWDPSQKDEKTKKERRKKRSKFKKTKKTKWQKGKKTNAKDRS